MSGTVYRPVEEILNVLETIRDDGVTLPPGYLLMWEIPHSADADHEHKTHGQAEREEGERRYLDHPIAGITAILGRHAEREAQREARERVQETLLAEVRAKVGEKGGDADLVDETLMRTILDTPVEVAPGEEPPARDRTMAIIRPQPRGRPGDPVEVEVPKLTRAEIAEVKQKANAEGRQIVQQRKAQHDARMNLKRGKVAQEIAELRAQTPASEKAGGKRHVLLEVFCEQAVDEIDGSPVLAYRGALADGGHLRTITHLRWKVYRWVEYEAIDTAEELAALVASMVEDLDAKRIGPPGLTAQPPVSRAGLQAIARARGRVR